MFTHGITFGGHPVAAAVALANLDIFEREDLCGHVREKEGEFRGMLDKLQEDLPIVGDVRGAGYFHALELVKDKETKESFSDEESEELLRGFMSGELFEHGLICRADDRGDPVIQLSPPLIADTRAVRGHRPGPAPGAHRGLGADRPPLRTERGRRHRCSPFEGSWPRWGSSSRPARTSADAPVRWVHISELPDPTPWLSGGELLLTTGIQLDDRERQREFVRLLAGHHLAGLGFGTGFDHDELPAALLAGGRRARLPGVRGARTSCRSSRSPRRPSRGS